MAQLAEHPSVKRFYEERKNRSEVPADQVLDAAWLRQLCPLLDSEEAAALLKIHPKTLQKLARQGEVTAIQIGKLWRFRASALNRWLQKIAS